MRASSSAPPSEGTTIEVVRWSLYVFAALLPWVTSNLTLFGFPYPLTANMFELPKTFALHLCVTVGTLAWAYGVFSGAILPKLARSQLLLAGAAALIALSTLLTEAVGLAFVGRDPRYFGALLLLDGLLLALLASQSMQRQSALRRLAWALCGSAGLLAAYTLLQRLGLDPVFWGQGIFDTTRPSATFGNPTLLGGFLVLPLIVAVGLALDARDKRAELFGWSCAIVVAAALLTTSTRAAWLGALIGLAVVGFAAYRQGHKLSGLGRGVLIAAGAAAALTLAITMVSSSSGPNVTARIAETLRAEGSIATRRIIWDKAVDVIAQNPLTGAGPSTFAWEYLRRTTADDMGLEGGGMYADDAHSLPLQFAADIGLPATVAILGYLSLVLVGSARRLLVRNADRRRLLLAAWWAGTVGLFVHTTASPTTTYVAFLWLGIGVLTPVAAASLHSPPRVARSIGVLAAVFAVASLWLLVATVRADGLFMRAQQTADLDTRIALLERSVATDSRQDAFPAALGYAHLAQVRDILRRDSSGGAGSLGPAFDSHLSEGESAFREAIDRAPREPTLYYGLAWLYLSAFEAGDPGALALAQEAIDAGLERAPNLPSLISLRARQLLLQGDTAAALEAAQAARGIDPDSPEVLTILAEAFLAVGQPRDALSALDQGLLIAPNDPAMIELRARVMESLEAP